MISNDLQNRIHFGDRDAFLAVYEEYGRGVYAAALKALGKADLAKSAVKQTFLTLHEEILTELDDFDIPVRVRELAEREIALQRILCCETCALHSETQIEPEYFSARGAFPTEGEPKVDLPPLERGQSFRRPRKALFVSKKKRKQPDTKKGGALIKTLIVLIDLFLIWALAGVLMGLGYLPAADLGYRWFLQHILPFFARFS